MLASLAAASAPACRSVIGADREDYDDAAEELCICASELNGLFSTQKECQDLVRGRLETGSPQAVGDWLTKYDDHCKKDCGAAKDCYYTLPVCSFAGCTRSEECCSYDGGDGACEKDSGLCAPPPP